MDSLTFDKRYKPAILNGYIYSSKKGQLVYAPFINEVWYIITY